MTGTQLLAKAKAAKPSARGKFSTDSWMPAVMELRAKHFTYEEIWQWFRDQGVAVHDRPISFTTAVSRRLRSIQRREMQGGTRK